MAAAARRPQVWPTVYTRRQQQLVEPGEGMLDATATMRSVSRHRFNNGFAVRALGKAGLLRRAAAMYWSAGLAIPPPLIESPPIVNAHPAQVINMSLGGTGPCSATYAEAVRNITAHGVLVVVSAGNDGKAVDSPANCAGAVGVGGLRHIGTKVGYSNLGSEVAISAPAGNCPGTPLACEFALNTTTNAGSQGPTTSTYTDTTNSNSNVGTSFSSPLVAATAGLMKSVNSRLTPALLTARLRASARPFPTTSTTRPTPPACVSPSVTALQEAECICNTQVCGAGMPTLRPPCPALRPAPWQGQRVPWPFARYPDWSAASCRRRTIATYVWTVEAWGRRGNPGSATLARHDRVTTTGSFSLRLTVTDNHAASDAPWSGQATVYRTTSPPPYGTSNGGGTLSALPLSLLPCAVGLAPPRRNRRGRLDLIQALILASRGHHEYLPSFPPGTCYCERCGIEAGEAANSYAIAIQAGAIVAVLGTYRQRVIGMTRGVFGQDPAGLKLALCVIAAFIPAAILGTLFDDRIEEHLFGVKPVIVAWVLGGILILALGRWIDARRQGNGLDSLTWKAAVLVGFIQCIAMWPGTSRSLVTILGGLAVVCHSPQRGVSFCSVC